MVFLGVHIEGSVLKAVLIKNEKKQFSIEWMRAFEGDDVKPFDILEPLLKGKEVSSVTGLDSWQMLVRPLELKLKSKRAIASVLPFQAESLLSHPLEEMVVLPIVTEQNKEGSTLSLFALTHVELNNHLSRMAERGIDPDVISCSAIALARTAQFLYPEKEELCLFHFGWDKSTYLSIRKGNPLFCQTVPLGMKDFVQAQEADNCSLSLEEVDWLALDAAKFPRLHAMKNQLEKQLERMYLFLQSKKACFADLLLTGRKDVQSIVHKHFGNSCNILDAKELINFAIPLGLALDAAASDAHSIQFRQGTFISVRQKQKKKKMLTQFLIGSCCLLVMTAASFQFWINKKQKALLEQIQEVAHIEINNLSDALQEWDNQLSSVKPAFPYLPTVPRVSDVLAWASTHPILSKGEIEIKRLRYTLNHYPALGQKVEPYEANVEMEFTASTPRAARELHDALLAGDHLVNPKHEISWNTYQNTYRTNFALMRQNP